MVREPGVPDQFVELLDECALLISDSGAVEARSVPVRAEPLPSLMEQIRELTQQIEQAREPIRTVHHFACTGGTLITKCLASLPNTRVLSEVEPLSKIPLKDGKRFFPTDLIQLLRTGTYHSSQELESEVFLRGLSAIYEHSVARGQRLLLRDHAHSTYCVGPETHIGPGLRETLSGRFALRSAVTVRHPLDTMLSISANGWMHFEPATLEEFCRRYHRFLDDMSDLPITRYEDFIATPQKEVERLAGQLRLPFNPDFVDVFTVHALSGDSGRKGRVIAARPRRPVPRRMLDEALASEVYHGLCSRLGYDPEIRQEAAETNSSQGSADRGGQPTRTEKAATAEESLRSKLDRTRLPTVEESLALFKRLSPDNCSVVLDIGVQKSSPFLMKVLPNSHHHLFEPVSLYHHGILKTYASAGIEHTLHRIGLSNLDAELYLHKLGRDGSGRVTHAQVKDVPDEAMPHLVEIERVPVKALDGMREQLGLRDLGYIVKIDVDGNEERIVAGGEQTLRGASLVMIEALLVERTVLSRAHMIEALGFRLWDICDNAYYFQQLSQVDLVFINERLYDRNLRFRPWDETGGLVKWENWQHGFAKLR